MPAKQGVRGRGGSAKDRGPNYTISGAGKATAFVTTFKCKSCSEHLPIKSNRGVSLEYKRLSRYLIEPDRTCTNNQCNNHHHGLKKHPEKYQRFGKTRHGSSRYRCKSCKFYYLCSLGINGSEFTEGSIDGTMILKALRITESGAQEVSKITII